MTGPDKEGVRAAIDRRIRSWLESGPSTLAADASRPFEVRSDRTRGRYVVLGSRAAAGGNETRGTLAGAASVEALYAQALLAARAAGLRDTGFEDMERTRALLASDYLHALAYAGVERSAVEPSLGRACYRSLARASTRLTATWSRATQEGVRSMDRLPIEPVVTAAAGDLAGCLAGLGEEGRQRLRTTGALVGLGDWRADIDQDQALPLDFSPSMAPAVEPGDSVDVLAPLPDTEALDSLEEFVDRLAPTPQEGKP